MAGPPGAGWQPPQFNPAGHAPPPRGSQLPWIIGVVVMSVLLVGAVVFAARQFTPSPPPAQPPPPPVETVAQGPPDWQPYVEAGKAFAASLLSLSAATAERDVQRILAASTGQFRDEFAARSVELTKVTRDGDVTTSATVNEAGLESFADDTARVLVAATARTSNNRGAQNQPRAWRLRMTVVKVADEFKTSTLEFVA